MRTEPTCGWVDRAAGLSFFFKHPCDTKEGSAGREAAALEAAFQRQHALSCLPIDRVLSGGNAAVHILLAATVLRTGALVHAAVTLATALTLFGLAVLASKWPETFVANRRRVCIVIIVGSMASSNFHINAIHLSSCRPAGGPLFWASEATSAALPWMLLHALVFPLPMPLAVPAHTVAALTLVGSDVLRCQKSLAACPAGAAHFQALQTWLARAFGVFSATTSATPGAVGAAAAGSLTPCVATYLLAQALTCVGLLHAVWLFERAARLSFLARTDRVDLEWSLERMRAGGVSAMTLALEMAAVLAVLTVGVHAVVPAAMAWLGHA